jgi:acetyl-CoA acetyltransferase
MSRDPFERRAVISGVGQSAIGRQLDRSGFQLTLDAILAAIKDAGLTVDDIDGLAIFPGGGQANVPGYSGANLYEVQDALRITTTWRQGQVEGACLPFYGPALAIATGQARHVVIFRTVKEGSAARKAGGRPAYGSTKPTAEGPLAWLLPLGPATCTSMASVANSWPGSPSCSGPTQGSTPTRFTAIHSPSTSISRPA